MMAVPKGTIVMSRLELKTRNLASISLLAHWSESKLMIKIKT